MMKIGLGLFLLGVTAVMLPLGEIIGSELPQRDSFITWSVKSGRDCLPKNP